VQSHGCTARAQGRCSERGSLKFEKAALRWLKRYLIEGSPRLQHFSDIANGLAQRER
jgi:hypothetical protein